MHSSLYTSLLCLLAAQAASAAVITTTVSAAPSPTSPSYSSDSAFKSSMLIAHNFYRLEHGVANLTWNDTSAKFGADWAKKCAFKHSGGPTGENLSAGYANATASVEVWGLEREKYNFKKPGFNEDTGHFTQLVWSNTTSVGCGRFACNGDGGTPGYYVVCEYYPAGNLVGDDNRYFKENVKAQTNGSASDTVASGVTKKSQGSGLAVTRWEVSLLSAAFLAMVVVV